MKFQEWFKEQFGKCPSNKNIDDLRIERDALRNQLSSVQFELDALTVYETRKDAAYKAWLAKPYLF